MLLKHSAKGEEKTKTIPVNPNEREVKGLLNALVTKMKSDYAHFSRFTVMIWLTRPS